MNHPIDIDTFQPDAVIIANGQFPSLTLMNKWLSRSPYTVCCDGAANRFLPLGWPCHLIVGDGDSLSPEVRIHTTAPIIHIAEQETNDLSKAVRQLHGQGKKRLVILGGTGLREDHTMANISLLVHYLQQGITAIMPTDYGVFLPCHDNVAVKVKTGQQISIFRYDATGLSGENLKYPLRDFSMLWQGTLNEATADTVRIHAKGYYLLYLVTQTEEEKEKEKRTKLSKKAT